jgi:hypothetical protein
VHVVENRVRGGDGVARRQHVDHGGIEPIRVHRKCEREVRLLIKVEDEGPEPGVGPQGRQAAGERGLARAALLCCHRCHHCPGHDRTSRRSGKTSFRQIRNGSRSGGRDDRLTTATYAGREPLAREPGRRGTRTGPRGPVRRTCRLRRAGTWARRRKHCHMSRSSSLTVGNGSSPASSSQLKEKRSMSVMMGPSSRGRCTVQSVIARRRVAGNPRGGGRAEGR